MCTIAGPIQVRPSLKWRSQPRFRPVSLNLSMTQHNDVNIMTLGVMNLIATLFITGPHLNVIILSSIILNILVPSVAMMDVVVPSVIAPIIHHVE